MTEFLRFPHTPHVAWLSKGQPRSDKVLSPREASELLAGKVVIEEKVDGANLGFSVDATGELRAQNRGSYLSIDAPQGQWKPLRRWVSERRERLIDALGPHLMLFGEWCYAVHSVHYVRLPDWFLAFDVFDRSGGRFWSSVRRDEFLRQLDITPVPRLALGHFALDELKHLIGRSQLTDELVEGVYIRSEDPDWLLQRAKLVRAEFVQSIDIHWSKRPLRTNALHAPR